MFRILIVTIGTKAGKIHRQVFNIILLFSELKLLFFNTFSILFKKIV